MNGNASRKISNPAADGTKELADIFEKTLLEIAILDSLYGGNAITERVKYVFQASVEHLRNSGTPETLAALFEDDDDGYEQPPKDDDCSDGERFTQEYAESLDRKIQTLKRKQERIDSIVVKCTEDGERTAIRRETEKNYVDKWEKARVENVKLNFKAEEFDVRKEMTELVARLETEKIVDVENEKFLDYTIKELENQIEFWECKYKTDVIEIDKKIESLMISLKEKTKEVENLKKAYNERQTTIEEHEKNKRKLEEEKKINDYKEKMVTKIQAWWRGTMVRRRLGPYKQLLGPRKKSIKKPLNNKGKKPSVK